MSALADRHRPHPLTATIHEIERSPRIGRQRLDDCVDIYGNPDDVMRDFALAAFAEGRPAYWSTRRGHSQVAACLCSSANLMSSLEAAIGFEFQPWQRDRIVPTLATLVPLNGAAAQELSEAYAARGIWRDVDELEVRRLRDLGRAA